MLLTFTEHILIIYLDKNRNCLSNHFNAKAGWINQIPGNYLNNIKC
jgi:hypothetical protein